MRLLHLKSFDSKSVSISGLDSAPEVSFRNLFLRDACSCPESVDISTSQKTFSTAQLAEDIAAIEAQVVGESEGFSEPTLKIQWNDGHSSTYSKTFLERYSSPKNSREYRKLGNEYWKKWSKGSSIFSGFQTVKYGDYMIKDAIVNDVVKALTLDGIAIIEDIPKSDPSEWKVKTIAQRISYIKNTLYGSSWDVVSVPSAKNVAYTSVYLPLHMDLLYYESPPGVQLLHVLHNSTKGGESIFADSYAAALHVKENCLEAYDALTKVPMTYHYVNDNYHNYYQRPLIEEDINSPVDSQGNHDIKAVNYSPPFQGPLDSIATVGNSTDTRLAEFFHKGLKMFESYVEDPSNQVEFRLQENSCVIFANRRILHARRQFDQSSGQRHFQGTYLDIEGLYSRFRTI